MNPVTMQTQVTWAFMMRHKFSNGSSRDTYTTEPRTTDLERMIPIAIRQGISSLILDGAKLRLASEETTGMTGRSVMTLEILQIDGETPVPQHSIEIAEKMGADMPDAILYGARYDKAADLLEDADFGEWHVNSSEWREEGEDRLVCDMTLEMSPRAALAKMEFAVDFEPGFSMPLGDPEFDLPKAPHLLFGYYVNLDERGDYSADIRDASGRTIFEIKAEPDGTIGLIEDGFMSSKTDLDGLRAHLVDLGFLPTKGELLHSSAFEEALPELEDAPAEFGI